MRNNFLAVWSLMVIFMIGGCSAIPKAEEAVADVEQGIAETQVFSITATQAESIIKESFHEGWPDKELEPLGPNKLGYQITLWFAIDREHILAEAKKSSDGYSFKVTNRGTAPVVGVPARKKLIELIQKNAVNL